MNLLLLLAFFVGFSNGFLEQPASTYYGDLSCENGRDVMVFLFEWRWDDIERECPKLAEIGYCSVQTSIVNEHAVVDDDPWWERYQPVSYKINTHSGDEKAFAQMVKACNAVGVRVVVDVVLNHMANGKGVGIGGTPFDRDNLDYPGAGFTKEDFNSQSECSHPGQDINTNYSTPDDFRVCDLFSLPDLNQSRQNVREKQGAFLDHLVSLGVAGFRLDGAKYEYPHDLQAILSLVRDTEWGTRPFAYSQVSNVLPNEVVFPSDYFEVSRVTEFRLGIRLARALLNDNSENLKALQFVLARLIGEDKALTFVDMQTLQRGTLEGADAYLNFKQPKKYQMATALLLALDYGMPRVFSSYFFRDVNQGPPTLGGQIENVHDLGEDGNFNTSKCKGGWVCEHRWESIQGMVNFNNLVRGSPREIEYLDKNVIVVKRTGKGVLAMSTDFFTATIDTGLPEGTYCDQVSLCQLKITVRADGKAMLFPRRSSAPIVALAGLAA